jgi:hypothetical protein
MGDAARHSPQHFHLLRLAHLRFQFRLLRFQRSVL